ncbi:hypothetical protein [Asticcacaulis machinosus]|uniref:Uncharacterized protein n=1 Tax=Asticcacaulis machinosus TaxID=2984211 RepID=A0ABT5HIV3_9CAUL|nr:hypothetical protein [Asticcacaulis machinosus]MDC7676091.1 hypothetical protein [Asticcacaulis machinosus]
MARFKFSARTTMILGSALMIAPIGILLAVYVSVGQLPSTTYDMSGHFGRYEMQAQIGAGVLFAGLLLRLFGLMWSDRAQG